MAPPLPPRCGPICSRPSESSVGRSNPNGDRTVNMAHQAEIPYGAYWSTPFARWQGAYAHLNALEFAAYVARAELDKRGIAPDAFDYGVLGTTVPQPRSFYGLPWVMGMIGAERIPGPTINQACATEIGRAHV